MKVKPASRINSVLHEAAEVSLSSPREVALQGVRARVLSAQSVAVVGPDPELRMFQLEK
jgi:hypothetical protein